MRGSLFMTLSMAGFAVEDAFIKSAAVQLPVGQVIATMGLIGIVVFSLMALRAGQPAVPRAALSRMMAVRSVFEVVGRLFYALAIAYTPLTSASAILQATPLVVVPAAAWLFGETVGLVRSVAVVLGFIGVLVILQPGLAGFSAMSLLAVTGMLGFAGRDLATRAAPPALSNAQLGVAGFTMLTVSGIIILIAQGGPVWPETKSVMQIAGAAGFGIIGYGALTNAMRTGQISAVAPFRYTRLVFAMVLGLTIFGERPDLMTLLGSALIVSCGVLVLTTGRRPRGAAV
ncbi:MAG: DMT family transporter [Deltaproteobacteria bacterium]